jgi:hypothetical protein
VGHHQVETRIFEKTHILQRGHHLIHLISTGIESHNGDDATKDGDHYLGIVVNSAIGYCTL